MKTRLAASLCVVLGTAVPAPTDAQCGEVSSFAKIRAATFVGEVRVRSRREWTYLDRGEVRSCGFFYEADVLDTWKGDPPARVEFFSENTLPFGSGETYLTILEPGKPRPELAPEILEDFERAYPGERVLPCAGVAPIRAREATLVPPARSFVVDDPLPFWIYFLIVERGDADADLVSVETLRSIVEAVAEESPV
jgi:hypothetical protein